jgi:hypothetical protein
MTDGYDAWRRKSCNELPAHQPAGGVVARAVHLHPGRDIAVAAALPRPDDNALKRLADLDALLRWGWGL